MASDAGRFHDNRCEETDQGDLNDKVGSFFLLPMLSDLGRCEETHTCSKGFGFQYRTSFPRRSALSVRDQDQGDSRWETMNKDCLLKIFSLVPTEDLLQSVPLVCKAWRETSLYQDCWTRLDFRGYPPIDIDPYSVTHFQSLLKLAASRSQGRATVLMLPYSTTTLHDAIRPENLDFAAEALTGLQVLICGVIYNTFNQRRLSDAIGKWSRLVALSIGADRLPVFHNCLDQTLTAISSGCPSFKELQLHRMKLEPEAAAVLAQQLAPRLRLLSLADVFVPKDDLLLVLRACKRLNYLQIVYCNGFPSDDAEVMELGDAVEKFIYRPFPRNDDLWGDDEMSMSDVSDDDSDDCSDDEFEL